MLPKAHLLLGVTSGLVVGVHRFAIDEQLPFMLNIFLAQSFGLLGTLTVISYATSGIFLLAVPPLAWAYVRLQRTYRATSREIKRIDAVTRSPLNVRQRATLITLHVSLWGRHGLHF